MYHRAFKICSPEYIDLELDRIMDIGLDLGYAPSFLKKSLCKVREKHCSANSVRVLNVNREHPFKDRIVLNLAFNHCFLPLRSILSTYFNVIKFSDTIMLVKILLGTILRQNMN